MPTQEHDDPAHVSAKLVHAGEDIPVAVAGGFVRQPAPYDGVLFETNDSFFFVGRAWLAALLSGRGAK